jgi:hypothetical protein
VNSRMLSMAGSADQSGPTAEKSIHRRIPLATRSTTSFRIANWNVQRLKAYSGSPTVVHCAVRPNVGRDSEFVSDGVFEAALALSCDSAAGSSWTKRRSPVVEAAVARGTRGRRGHAIQTCAAAGGMGTGDRPPAQIDRCLEWAALRTTKQRSRFGVDSSSRVSYRLCTVFFGAHSRRDLRWRSHVLISSIQLWPDGTTA